MNIMYFAFLKYILPRRMEVGLADTTDHCWMIREAKKINVETLIATWANAGMAIFIHSTWSNE